MANIRAFIAIELPPIVQAYLDELALEFKEIGPIQAVKWVKSSNIHLTLRFLGDTATDLLPALYEEVDAACQDFSAFELFLTELGCFPSQKRPRVIWVGIDSADPDLMRLQKAIEKHVVSLGWKSEDRQFHPHLTLGRVKDSKAILESGFTWNKPIESKRFVVDSVKIFESRLLPTGAVYSIRHTSLLEHKSISRRTSLSA